MLTIEAYLAYIKGTPPATRLAVISSNQFTVGPETLRGTFKGYHK